MNKKKINVKAMERLTKDESDILLGNLKKMYQFSFFVDQQISV